MGACQCIISNHHHSEGNCNHNHNHHTNFIIIINIIVNTTTTTTKTSTNINIYIKLLLQTIIMELHLQHRLQYQLPQQQVNSAFSLLHPSPAVFKMTILSTKILHPINSTAAAAAWREKLFHVDDMIVLTHDQFETYFPHVDNVYSHRSTQRYKRKPFISHYWDCRMKGRPPGTPKSDDPNKKKRKRNVRERDLCDVKIKITEYFPSAGAEAALDREVAAAVAAGAATVPAGQRFWTIQRVNGNGGNGKGDGVAGPHKHTLAKSDEIKKNSVQRHVAQQDKETKKTQPKPPQRRATGAASATVKRHSKDSDLKLYAACFCPFSQRVWIALEVKGLAYQYVETDPFRRPVPMPLLEANPRGRVPAIRQGEWACAESAVILEYPIAVCGSTISTQKSSLPSSLCSNPPPHQPPTQEDADCLQAHLTNLVLAADEDGPYFLGSSLSLVDIHFAPFALRLSRVIRPHRGWVDAAPGTRWQRWLDALERNPHVVATTSTEDMYLDTADLLLQNAVVPSDGSVAPMG
ncbi:hypothetical protein PT974_11766 [Cladobotryum mycophilum]|uniref:GST N-terminal domain-containing protein n=1 Tax=Cladobotryum mycophilum TaxID=491253 RepID=A0ABR0S6N3_9HYPO